MKGGLVTCALLLNNRVPNERVQETMKKCFRTAGVAMTLGLSKHPYTSGTWNTYVEPIFIDFLDNIAVGIKEGLIPGLRSDNKAD